MKAENKKLKENLESKNIAIKKSGSIAEASLQPSGIFEAAQKAADMYVENIKNKSEKFDLK